MKELKIEKDRIDELTKVSIPLLIKELRRDCLRGLGGRYGVVWRVYYRCLINWRRNTSRSRFEM